MAIQMRRGLKANLDTSRLVAGEIVVATDANEDYVAVAKAPSDVIQLATKNDLNGKVDVVNGKGLSTNDYTNADKSVVDDVTSALESKVDKVTGKGLSTNDYTDNDKTKVTNAVTKSSTSGLLKNDGTVDTTQYATAGDMGLSWSANGILGAKNLCPMGESKSQNQVAFTVDSNGIIDMNGTAYGDDSYNVATALSGVNVSKPMILSGCPSGGSASTFSLDAIIRPLGGGSAIAVFHDYGEGAEIRSLSANEQMDIRIGMHANQQYNHIKLSPMIRLASDTDTTYQPYAKTNRELTLSSGGGSTVVPNPTGTASTDLTKIGIDGTNYNIPTSDTTTCYKTSDTAETTLADDDKFPFYDTSASGKRSSTWSNIKAKLKSYFDTLYTGTVTSVSTGAGLTGGTITGSGTIKAKLKSETQSSLTAASKGSTADREYAVGLDASGNLSVNVPWVSGGSGTWEDITSDITFASGFTNTNSRFYRNGKMVAFTVVGTFSSYTSDVNFLVIDSTVIKPIHRFIFAIYIKDANTLLENTFKFGTISAYSSLQKGQINIQGTTLTGEVDVYGSGFFIEA